MQLDLNESGECSPHDWISVHRRRGSSAPSLCLVRKQQEGGHLETGKGPFPDTESAHAVILDSPASSYEKQISLKPLIYGTFVIAA